MSIYSVLKEIIRKKKLDDFEFKGKRLDHITVELNKKGYRVRERFASKKFPRGNRGKVSGFTKGSRNRLVRLCANNADLFRYFVTLTYHEVVQDGLRAKHDLNNFLTMLRQLGAKVYIWILEFQGRGSIHFHLWLGEHALENAWREDMPALRNRLREGLGGQRSRKQAMVVQYLWLRASDQLLDEKARKAAVDYQVIRAQHAVTIYAMKYGAKLVQKVLPEGVQSIGRLWGASREVKNEILAHGVDSERMYQMLMEFCERHNWQKNGSVVAECEQAEEAWNGFLDGVMEYEAVKSGTGPPFE